MNSKNTNKPDDKLKSISKILRIPEWYDSKVPLALSVMLFFFIMFPQEDIARAVLNLLLYFLFLFSYFALNYILNDYIDIEVDRKAGKDKLITKIPKPQVICIMIFLFITGFLPLYFSSGFNYKMAIILIVNYLFGASYHVKPLRFKERGLWGLIVSSAAQRCVPLLVIPLLCDINVQIFTRWIFLSFLNGLRYILIHQYKDYDSDLQGGVQTYVTKHRRGKFLEIGIYLFFTAEIITVLYLLMPLIFQYYLLIVVILIYAVLAIVAMWAVCHFIKEKVFLTFTYVPLEDFFNIFLPLLFAFLLTILTPSIWYLIALIALLFYLLSNIKNKCTLIFLPVRVKISGTKFNRGCE